MDDIQTKTGITNRFKTYMDKNHKKEKRNLPPCADQVAFDCDTSSSEEQVDNNKKAVVEPEKVIELPARQAYRDIEPIQAPSQPHT